MDSGKQDPDGKTLMPNSLVAHYLQRLFSHFNRNHHTLEASQVLETAVSAE